MGGTGEERRQLPGEWKVTRYKYGHGMQSVAVGNIHAMPAGEGEWTPFLAPPTKPERVSIPSPIHGVDGQHLASISSIASTASDPV